MKPLLTLDEAREYLGNPCSKTSFYEAVRRGQIPSMRIGRRLFVPLGKLNEAIGAADSSATETLPADLIVTEGR